MRAAHSVLLSSLAWRSAHAISSTDSILFARAKWPIVFNFASVLSSSSHGYIRKVKWTVQLSPAVLSKTRLQSMSAKMTQHSLGYGPLKLQLKGRTMHQHVLTNKKGRSTRVFGARLTSGQMNVTLFKSECLTIIFRLLSWEPQDRRWTISRNRCWSTGSTRVDYK